MLTMVTVLLTWVQAKQQQGLISVLQLAWSLNNIFPPSSIPVLTSDRVSFVLASLPWGRSRHNNFTFSQLVPVKTQDAWQCDTHLQVDTSPSGSVECVSAVQPRRTSQNCFYSSEYSKNYSSEYSKNAHFTVTTYVLSSSSRDIVPRVGYRIIYL